jgi:PAS domain S-box-containing protein
MAAKAGKRGKTTVQSADKKRPKQRSPVPPDRDVTVQEQKEDRLAHLASFPEMNPNPIVEVNVDGSIRYLNPAAQKLFSGLNKTELQQIWIGDLNSIREILEKERKDSFAREVQIGHRWFRQTIHQTAPKGGIIRIYAFDITERKQAEEALRQSQTDLNRAQAVAHTGSWRLDVRRNELLWSDETHRIFGIPQGTPMAYEAFLSTVHPDDREYVDTKWKAGLRGEPYDIEHRIVVDGQVKWVRERAELEFDKEGVLLGGFGTVQDITELRKAAEELRESKAQIETVVESLTEGLVVATLDGRLTHWNRAALEMHGFASHAEAERMLPEFADTFELASATGEILPVDRWPLARILRGEVLHNLEIHIRRHNGDWQRVWSYGGRLAQDESGNPFLAVVSVTDITERKRMEEALLKSREKLEKRVQERTAELRSVVEALQEEMAERKQAEESAKAERQRLHDVLETLPAYICLLTPDYYMPFANKVFRNRFGYYPDKKCYEFLFGRSEPCEVCETYTVLKTMAPHGWEWIGPDNRTYDVFDFPFADTDGSPLIMEMGIDITERKQAEEALRNASLYTRSLIEASLDPLVTINVDGKVTDVNKTTELITGISRDRLIGSDFSDYFTEPDRARLGYQKAFEEGSVRNYPLTIRDTKGHITEVLYNATVYKNETGEVQGVFAAARDITALKAAEQERLHLIAAIEQSSESIVITDDTGAILYANPAFGHINDYLLREARGKNYFDLLTGDGRDKGLKRKLTDILGKDRMWRDHFSRKKKDGASYALDVSISPVRDQSGKIINYSIIERDVTRETILEQHLRQQQKMEALGTLAGGIAHDFNNILMPIMINTELSLYDTPGTSPINQYLHTVLEAAQRGQELVNQIITFSRQKEQERKPIKLTPVIKEALRFLRATVSQNIELRENIDAESGMMLGDPTQIHQVVMNLCSNAAYAMREKGGMLEVSLTAVEVDAHMLAKHLDLKPGPYLKLTVSDTGHGMSQDIMKRIFDPFFTTKKTGEGTGMGLAVVHGIVKRHEGTIITYSEVGKGTTFNIFFPRIEGDLESEAMDLGAIPMGTERILFVDDEEVQVRSGQRLLERLGYHVVATTDGRDALEVFRSKPDAFDLVITDQSMPRLTGIRLAEKMMRIRPDIPVILCTGFSEGVDGKKARATGIREFMMKPFSVRQLAETIRRVLDARD